MTTSRADLHCHSTPATPPEALYAMAKARGMDFVTITDRDSIDGVLSIADRDDVFMSVELTARLRDTRQAVSVLCYGISAFDHQWLQHRRDDVQVCMAYLREHSIAYTLTEPFGAQANGEAVGGAYVETPSAETPWEFLAHLRGGHAVERGALESRAA
jgi:predicted metal-dependent phosphoesterase TrpH